MDRLVGVEETHYVQIHQGVLDVNVNQGSQEMHLNSVLVRLYDLNI